MYILLVSRGVPSDSDPQWGCFEKDQAKALAALGHKVVVVSVDSRFGFKRRKLGISKYVEGDIVYYDIYIIPGVMTRMLGYNFNLKVRKWQMLQLYRHVELECGKPDIIYSHYLMNSYIALYLKYEYNIPLVAIEHWSELNKPVLKRYVKAMGEVVYNNADALISVSESLRKMLLMHFSVDSIVIHNMVGFDFVYRQPIVHETFNFVSVGSLFYIKGYDILIKAFAKMRENSNIRLFIIGEGRQRRNLQSLIEHYKLNDSVVLYGRKNKKEIVEILRTSDVYVSSSRNENFSVSILEALSVGLPVIATDCGGIRECISDTNGLLVPTENEDALCAAMIMMRNNVALYDRLAISSDFKQKFSSEVIATKLTDLFETVLYSDHN